MSKRRKPAEPELPLFDLPLYSDSENEGAAAPNPPTAAGDPAAGDRPPPKAPKPRRRKRPPVDPGPMLFSEEELSAGTAVNPPSEAPLTVEAPIDATPSIDAEAALVQDRLLGGLADLTIHFATLGMMVVAVQLMGVPVRPADWPAFAALAIIFSFLYAVIPLAFWGHTPGMAWVGHSARSETDEPLSFGQTAMRWAGALFTVVLLGLPLLLALQGRSLADRLSDSKTLQL